MEMKERVHRAERLLNESGSDQNRREILESRKRVREAERVEETNDREDAEEIDDPWKLTPLKAIRAIFTGVATFLILRILFG